MLAVRGFRIFVGTLDFNTSAKFLHETSKNEYKLYKYIQLNLYIYILKYKTINI